MYQDQPILVKSPTRKFASFETNKGVQLKHTTKLQQTVQEWNEKIPALDSPQLSENALQQAGPAVKHLLHLRISYCKNWSRIVEMSEWCRHKAANPPCQHEAVSAASMQVQCVEAQQVQFHEPLAVASASPYNREQSPGEISSG